MNSLDPRVSRLPQIIAEGDFQSKALDQLSTFEVFVQPKEGKPFQHEGIVHAPDLEMAFILAKESLTRRFQCVSIFVTDTKNILASSLTEGDVNAYDRIQDSDASSPSKLNFEIFHLLKRGKQHIHAGAVEAHSGLQALAMAKRKFGSTKVFNVWAIDSNNIRYTKAEEADLWKTLPDKKFRDAAEYKGGEKLKGFLGRVNS